MMYRADRATLRLAFSYIFVVMAVSLTFSVFFYMTSVNALHVSGSTYLLPAHGGTTAVQPLPKLPSPDSTLKAEAVGIEHTLSKRLFLLNGIVLIVGSGVCFYLARRTLRPIEVSMEMQERFISDASHELKTPIAGIRLRNEVALRDPNLTLAEAKVAIEENIKQAIMLERLSASLLELAKQPTRRADMNRLSLEGAVMAAIGQCREIAQARSITVTSDLSPVAVMGVQEQLVQVFVILLDNAIKFSNEGSTVHVSLFVDKKDAVVAVRDEGQGIRDVDIPHVFERFYQGDRSRANQGSGLGLSIADNIVKRHGGKIVLKSTFGEGAEFKVLIPLK